ncbi:MAG: hypothetical protein LBL83_13530 [Clostridiales bacterium]|jgi:hypothetical protein|nr:hypothetical protein [Clostridiales bacterium]
MENSILDLLLGADKGKLQHLPTKKVEIARLSEIVGKPAIFTVRAITSEEYLEAQKHAIDFNKRGGVEDVRSDAYQVFVLMAGLIDPDIKSEALREHFGAATTKELLESTRFLAPGEFLRLFNEIAELSGFGEESVKEIKN